jgi:TRAP-type C4-dicarboxylate transport system substrate-binding protein
METFSMSKIAALVPLSFLLLASPAAAQTINWQIINEYPATSLPGEADAFFADAVKRKTDGRVVVTPLPDAKSGLRTRDQVKAVSEDRFAMADSFGGALADEDPAFLMSSLPFVTPSADHARKLYDAALPLYQKLFAQRGQKLLFVSPWPPSGIWSANPIVDRTALAAIRIRTYDKTGTDVFSKVAAQATVVSFADLNAKLESREIDAVLSSGDGGAGRQLWKFLPHFSNITYAIPLSFGTVSVAEWSKLDATTQAAIEEAGRETTDHQWAAMQGRVERNFKVMRDNGVTIAERPPLDVILALSAAGAQTLIEWQGKAGADAVRAFEDYQKRSQ